MVSLVRTWVRAHIGAVIVGVAVSISAGTLIVGCGLNNSGGGGSSSSGGSGVPPVITLVKFSGDAQSAAAATAVPLPLVAEALDQNNNPVPNQPVVWTVTNGFLTAQVAPTDTQGLSQVTLTCGLSAGLVTATATLGASSVTFTATAGALPAVKLSVSGFPAAIKATTPGTVTVTAQDLFGNTAAGYTGTVKFKSSDPIATLPATYTFTAGDAGVHKFPVTLNTCGVQSITATDTVTATITGTQGGISVTGGAATKFVVTGFATPENTGAPFDLIVSATDATGCPDPTYIGTVKITSSDLAAILPGGTYTFTAADAGVHKFPLGVTLNTGGGTQTVTATDTTSGNTGSATVTVLAAVRVTTLTSVGTDPLTPASGKVKGTVAVSWTGTGLGVPTAVSLTGTNQAAKGEPNGSPATDTPAQTVANSPFPVAPKFEDPFAFYNLSATTPGPFAKVVPEITQATQVSAGAGLVTATATASFDDGSYVVTGYYAGTATIGQPNQGGPTLTSAGINDVFVARYTAAGALAWAVTGGGPGDDQAFGVATSLDGTCVVTGYYSGLATFGGKALVSSGGKDVFVVKYSPAGVVLWAVSFGGTADDVGRAVGCFADGSCTVAGSYLSAPMTLSATKTLSTLGGNNVFVAHLTSSGTVVWAKSAGGTLDSFAYGVAATPDGRSVVAGSFTGSATFGALPAITSGGVASANTDAFIAGYGLNGAELWVNQLQTAIGAGVIDQANGVCSFVDGSVAVTGSYGGKATFVGGATSITSAGGTDMFLARYDVTGAFVSGVSGGGAGADVGTAVAALPDASVVVTGSYSVTATFGGTSITSAGGKDVFVGIYDSTSTLVWLRSAGGGSDDQSSGAAGFNDGSVAIVGNFSSATMTLGAGAALSLGGSTDAFVFKFGPVNYRMLKVRPSAFSSLTVSTVAGGCDMFQTGAASFIDGGSVVCGYYDASGTVSLGGASLPATHSIGGFDFFCASNGEQQPYLIRYNGDGTAKWAVTVTLPVVGSSEVFPHTTDSASATGVASFADGSCIYVGQVVLGTTPASGVVTFTDALGGAGKTITLTTTSGPDWGIFIVKYDPNGTPTYATFFDKFQANCENPISAGETGPPGVYQVCAFADGTYAIGGFYTSSFTFPGGKTLPGASGTADFFLAHFTAADVNDWVATGGAGGYTTQGTALTACPDGSTIATGTFVSGGVVGGGYSVTFGAKTLTDATATAATPTDAFLVKDDAKGKIVYAVNSTTSAAATATTCVPGGISAFPDGTCAMAGTVGNTGGQKFSGATLVPTGAAGNPFVIKFDLAGAASFGVTLTDAGTCGGFGAAAFRDGSIVITGFYPGGSGVLTCGSGVTLADPGGAAGVFVARYDGTGKCLWARSDTCLGTAQGIAIGTTGSADLGVSVFGFFNSTFTCGAGDPAAPAATAPSGAKPLFYIRYFNY